MKIKNKNELLDELDVNPYSEDAILMMTENFGGYTSFGANIELIDDGCKITPKTEGRKDDEPEFFYYPFELEEFWGYIDEIKEESEDEFLARIKEQEAQSGDTQWCQDLYFEE